MRLTDIKDYLNTLLASFSAVLDLELTILSSDPLERVAATGVWYQSDLVCYENNRLIPQWQNSYTMKVIETGMPIVAIDTKEFVFAFPNMRKNVDSRFYSVLAYPINTREKLEGVIVIASFDEEQHRIVVEKEQQLMAYLEKISDLISSKLEQEMLMEQMQIMNNQLTSVVEAMEDGILLYSPTAGISQSNMYVQKYLHFNDPELKEALLSEVISVASRTTEERPNLVQEIHKNIDGFQYLLQVKTKFIRDSEGSVLCIINPFSQIQNSITQNEREGLGVAEKLIFSGKKMRTLVNQAKIAAQHASNVLITGESGTGKEMFARLIHSESPRKAHPFVAMNCAAIPESLMESELFGYEEGAFTGARKGGKIGKIQLANHGTFFLDEIGDMPLYLQAKLLRVLSERKVDRIGSSSSSLINVDVRIIAATNRNLEEMIERKEFREDLYYRLNVVPLHLPPLRERPDDIPFLIRHFIVKYNKILEKEIRAASASVMEKMVNYQWPGNVRELENSIEYMMTFEKSPVLSLEVLPQKISGLNNETSQNSEYPEENMACLPLKSSIRIREQEILKNYAARYGGHPTKEQVREICRCLEISVASYYRKIGGGSEGETVAETGTGIENTIVTTQ